MLTELLHRKPLHPMGKYNLLTALNTVKTSPVPFSFRKGGKASQVLTPVNSKGLADIKSDIGDTTEAFKGKCYREDGSFVFAVAGKLSTGWTTLIKDVFSKNNCGQYKFTVRELAAAEMVDAPAEGSGTDGAAETKPTADQTPTAKPPGETPATDGPSAAELQGEMDKLTPIITAAARADQTRAAVLLAPIINFRKALAANNLKEAEQRLADAAKLVKELQPRPADATPPSTETKPPATETKPPEPGGATPDAKIEELNTKFTHLLTAVNAAIKATPTQAPALLDAIRHFKEEAKKNDFASAQNALAALANLLKKVQGGTATAAPSPAVEQTPPAAEQTPATAEQTAPATAEPEQTAKPAVAKAKQVIRWANPAPVLPGTKLSEAQLNAVLEVGNGTLKYSKDLGTELKTGKGQKLSVTAAATDEFDAATASVTIDVEPGTQVIEWNPPETVSADAGLTEAYFNATLTTGDGAISYQPKLPAVLKGDSVQLKASVSGTTAYRALPPVVRTVTIVRRKLTLVTNAGAAYVAGKSLPEQGFTAKFTVDGADVTGNEPKFDPPLTKKLTKGEQTFRVTEKQPGLYEKFEDTIKVNAGGLAMSITWDPPTEIAAGTPLSNVHLNAKVSQPESKLTYKLKGGPVVKAGTVLKAGDGQEIVVTASGVGQYGEASKSVTFNVKKAEAVINWTPSSKLIVGDKLTVAQLNATVRGGAVPKYSLALDTVTTAAGPLELSLTTPETDAYLAGKHTVTVNVGKAEQEIDWKAPADITVGTPLSNKQLNATNKTKDGGALTYAPAAPTELKAGYRQRLTVTAKATDNFNAKTASVLINVRKPKPTIVWPVPAVVGVDAGAKFKLTDDQLNATCAAGKGDGKPVYTPKLNAGLEQGMHTLKVTFPATDNFEQASATVRLIVDSAKAKEGADLMQTPQAWAAAMDANVQADWDNDVGDVQTEAKKLMTDLSTMSGPALKAHLDKLVTVGRDKKDAVNAEGEKYRVWKFPNRLQVRYKPDGDPFSNGEPTFCVELRTCAGFSAGQHQIAAKLRPDGQPAPKGPDATAIPPGMTAAEHAAYKNGSCAVTHPRCQVKLDPVFDWRDPADMRGPKPLSDVQLNAVLIEGDGALTYTPKAGFTPTIGQFGLVVQSAETPEYKAGTKSVYMHVLKGS